MFKKYQNWKGSRKDLINEIVYFENRNPEKFRMISKKSGDYIDVNIRRIQQFIDVSILPKPHVEKKQYEYTKEHLLRYLAAIVLKNNDHTIKQIEKILSTLDIDQVEQQILTKDSKNLKLDKVLFEEKDKINLFQKYFELLYQDIYQQFTFYKKEIEACAMVLLEKEIIYQESIFSTIQKIFQESNKFDHLKENRIIFIPTYIL